MKSPQIAVNMPIDRWLKKKQKPGSVAYHCCPLQNTEAMLTVSASLSCHSQKIRWGLLEITVTLQDNNLCSRQCYALRAVREYLPFIAFCHPGSVACGQMDQLIFTNKQ